MDIKIKVHQKKIRATTNSIPRSSPPSFSLTIKVKNVGQKMGNEIYKAVLHAVIDEEGESND